MQDICIENEMADQQTLRRIEAVESSIGASNNRLDRFGERLQKVSDASVDFATRTARLEERTSMMLWVFGPAAGIFAAVLIAIAVQLFLMGGRVSGMESDLRHVSGTVDGMALKQLAGNPAIQQNIAEAKDILRSAKSKQIKIPEGIVKEAAANFLNSSQSNAQAWDVIPDFLNYQSFLNATYVPKGKEKQISSAEGFEVNYRSRNVLNDGQAKVSYIGISRTPDVAEFRNLDERSLNEGKSSGPGFLKFDGAILLLDGIYMKRIIVKDSHVIYHGGPVVLDNVYFVNCTFELDRRPNAQSLAAQIVQSSPASVAKVS